MAKVRIISNGKKVIYDVSRWYSWLHRKVASLNNGKRIDNLKAIQISEKFGNTQGATIKFIVSDGSSIEVGFESSRILEHHAFWRHVDMNITMRVMKPALMRIGSEGVTKAAYTKWYYDWCVRLGCIRNHEVLGALD